MIDYLNNILPLLSNTCSIGNVKETDKKVLAELSKYADTKVINGGIVGTVGEGDYTLMLAAHIDEVGFVVTDIDSKGFLTVQKVSGIDIRHLPSRRVVIHGKEDVDGVFCSIPPHIKSGDETKFDDIESLKIDTLLGKRAKEVISVGDFVTYKETAAPLIDGRITGKALDNRVGVSVLLCLARELKEKELPIKVAFTFTGEEELGCRGAGISAFSIKPDEAIAIDVTFGDGPDVNAKDCGKLCGGAMIGAAPVLCREITDKLTVIAKDKDIPYALEIMSERTGTDADKISLTARGIKTGLLSVPIRNMHTPVEVVDINDIVSAVKIFKEYILSGGIKNV